MAKLIACTACKKKLSVDATACPKCGHTSRSGTSRAGNRKAPPVNPAGNQTGGCGELCGELR